jgi:hypothetical protein
MCINVLYSSDVQSCVTVLREIAHLSSYVKVELLVKRTGYSCLTISSDGIVLDIITIIHTSATVSRPASCPDLVVPIQSSIASGFLYPWLDKHGFIVVEEYQHSLIHTRNTIHGYDLVLVLLNDEDIAASKLILSLATTVSSWKAEQNASNKLVSGAESMTNKADEVLKRALEYSKLKEEAMGTATAAELEESQTRTVSTASTVTATSVGNAKAKAKKAEDSHAYHSSASPNPWQPPLGRSLPSIYPALLHLGEHRPITANSPAPIPFQTELLTGKVLMMLRTNPLDKLYRHRFEGTTYMVEVQVQGKFNKIPDGPLFFGAEISKKMELGLFTRGLCGTIIQLARSFNPFLHSSFGDKNNDELPHLVVPVWSAVDRLTISQPGDVIPPLGQVFPENLDARARRRAMPGYVVDVDLSSTYSFSFKSSNLDLLEWKSVNLPVMKSMDLHTFWNDSDIRFIAYCLPASVNYGSTKLDDKHLPKFHYKKDMNTFFSLEIRHKSNHPEFVELPVGLDDKEAVNLELQDQGHTTGLLAGAVAEVSEMTSEDEIVDADDDAYVDESEDESQGNDELSDQPSASAYDSDLDDDSRYHDAASPSMDRKPISNNPDDRQAVMLNYDRIDCEFVYSVIEVDDRRRSNTRRTLYAFLANPWLLQADPSAHKVDSPKLSCYSITRSFTVHLGLHLEDIQGVDYIPTVEEARSSSKQL